MQTKIDMSWGSPLFLQPYWESRKIFFERALHRQMGYSFGSIDALKATIQDVHLQEKNAILKNRRIVVASGATQLILGLMQVLKDLKGRTGAWAHAPYFSRFPSLAKISGLNWGDTQNAVRLCTIPNNPDGSTVLHDNSDILDLTYNWPQYAQPKAFDHPLCVFSLSKATGHASSRIGWALIEDPIVADCLEHHLEHATSGISIDSQLAAEAVLKATTNVDYTVFEDGLKTLEIRHGLIKEIKKTLPFQILSMSGMFLWANGECPKQVIGLDGRVCGGAPGDFRLNIGCSKQDFVNFYKLFSDRDVSQTIL